MQLNEGQLVLLYTSHFFHSQGWAGLVTGLTLFDTKIHRENKAGECSDLNWTFIPHSCSQGLGIFEVACKSPGVADDAKGTVFSRHNRVDAWMNSWQLWQNARDRHKLHILRTLNLTVEQKVGTYEVLLLPEECSALDSSWEMECQFSLMMWPLRSCWSYTTAGPSHKSSWAAQTGLDGERRKTKNHRNLRVGWEGQGWRRWSGKESGCDILIIYGRKFSKND